MAFTLGAFFIDAKIENGENTFGLSANNALVNALESITMKSSLGGVTDISISLAPTFPQALQIIEGGILGYGFPAENKVGDKKNAQIRSNMVESLGDAKVIGDSYVSLSMQVGYVGNHPLGGTKGRTPWYSGMITAPTVHFGKEISLTINATAGIGRTMLNTCKDRSFKNETLKNIVEKIVFEDCLCEVDYLDDDIKKEMSEIIISKDVTDNSMTFVKEILEKYGFYYYMSAGSSKNAKETLHISTLRSQNNKKPPLTLRMYGQIDVANGIYPIDDFETDLGHLFVTGSSRSSSIRVFDTETKPKEATIKKYTTKEHAEKNKILGHTADLGEGVGVPTKGGSSSGYPVPDKEKSGKKFVGLSKSADDNEHAKGVESETFNNTQRAFQTTIKSIFIPEIQPGDLVNVEVFSGNRGIPMFKAVSGIYRVIELEHSLSPSGGNTSLTISREVGSFFSTGNPNVVLKQSPKIDSSPYQKKSLVGGVIA